MIIIGTKYGVTDHGSCSGCGYVGPGPMHACAKCAAGHVGKCPHHCKFCEPEIASGEPGKACAHRPAQDKVVKQ